MGLLAIGEMLIDLIPEPHPAGGPPCYRPYAGGAPANAAVAAARLGRRVRFWGRLSRDAFGQMLLAALEEEGVDTGFVQRADDPTALAVVELDAAGQRRFRFYHTDTADAGLDAAGLAEGLWVGMRIAHAGSVSLAALPAREATLAALREARARGLVVSLDVNARPGLWPQPQELPAVTREALRLAEVVKLSDEDAAALQLEPDPVDWLLAEGAGLVLFTRGAAGARLASRRAQVEMEAFPVQAVDSTGAGDAFMGAALAWLLDRQLGAGEAGTLDAPDLRALGRQAAAAGALACTRRGGIASLPDRAELEAFLKA
ncbi:PfkB domain-containing protein [Candidatus Hydrogenisulfobacillus filiaventi]|uniref:PfkB domain-containing protein n=1 Tax=Candidatus Hydrogenisulfobacillus filiaventi TaxID=2707344 RepID=A0A6F8ZGS0_9FIRM|nr:carbohydrate kinase [Bacillota bacterium]CAB1128836.1 PfkB domain-containing protein [Candidatus Hydrogenisulfobacillus filiaventi]